MLVRKGSTFLGTEFNRIRAGKPSVKFSTRRVKAQPPAKVDDIEGWDKALAEAKANYGYESTKTVHLQLLKKYGKDAWMSHNDLVNHTKEFVERELEETKISINEINLARKRAHERAGAKLSALESRYWDLLQRGFAVEGALEEMNNKKTKV